MDFIDFPKWENVIKHARFIRPSMQVSPLFTDRVAVLRAVQEELAHFMYIPEGDKDVWKTPEQFKKDKGGDCEDFAIARYYRLLDYGFKDSEMEIAVVRIIDSNQIHAILLVHVGPDTWYLDNMEKEIQNWNRRKSEFNVYYYINRIDWHE